VKPLIALAAIVFSVPLHAQDPREIVRRSIELDQINWSRAKDYTWNARDIRRHLDSKGQVQSVDSEGWETLILYGLPYRRLISRDGKPLPPDKQAKEQRKLDEYTAKLEHETEAERQRHVDKYLKDRQKLRAFLREIPDLFDFHLDGDAVIDGRPVWVISGAPRPGARPKSRDAGALLKIRGRIWIDKAEYQWVRIEGETTDTISWGIFLARLSPGARLEFEQTRVNDEVWLPKRMWMRGAGRIGLLKKLAMEEEITWSDYRKFQAESRIVSDPR
jgi:hypothetical protein